ncbi:FAD-binding oxidoreductase [Arenibaculum sp.]|uniref:NAD(P)/FAD-dependent oxidoreductase n=1 Tax=Arenibaculum sp. TaxID=2865862 RepID=UPI002E166883|nr:FAD-binding oxidoreductase [Arenibaculum sp.]
MAQPSVIVVGAGIVGMSAALALRMRGLPVTVVDRQAPGHGTSFGNAGTFATYEVQPIATPGILRNVPRMLLDPSGPLAIRWQYLPRLLPWLARFVAASAPSTVERITRELASLTSRADEGYRPLFEVAGATDLIRREGALYVYTRTGAQDVRRRAEEYRSRGVCAVPLERGELEELEPNLSPDCIRGLLYPDAFHTVSPLALTERFVQAFLGLGGTIEQAEVAAIDAAPDGERVVLRDGRVLTAERVVLAAGVWSRALAAGAGARVPLDTERGYHLVFPGAGNLLRRPVCWYERGFYVTPMADGLRVAGTVELGGTEAPARAVRLRALERGVRALLPVQGAPASEWMGFRPSMPDSKPVIGAMPGRPSVIHAFGHGHLGLTLAGITGRIVADLVTGAPPPLDVGAFSPTRFARRVSAAG